MAKNHPTQKNRSQEIENRQQQIVRQSVEWSGPIPPPAALEHFDRIIPGGAERILKMAEQEQVHRQDMDKISIGAEIADARLGKILGTGIAALAIAAAVINAWLNGPWEATAAFVGVPLLGVATALIRNFRSK